MHKEGTQIHMLLNWLENAEEFRLEQVASEFLLQWSCWPRPDRPVDTAAVEPHTESDQTQLTEHRLDTEQTPS